MPRSSGTLSDTRGTRLPRVTVVVRSRETGTERTAVTGPDGAFLIGNLAPGVYDITVTDPGFVSFKREVTLVEGTNEPLELQLSYTVSDFSPVTDRWRLRFPLWQRYPDGSGRRISVRSRIAASIPTTRTSSRAICRSSATTSSSF